MIVEFSSLLGVGGLAAVVIGGVIARDRQITNIIHKNHEEIIAAISDGDDKLHERINRTRDDMSNMYVKRADLDGHLQRIENSVASMRQEMREERRDTNSRLDAVLSAISGNKSSQ